MEVSLVDQFDKIYIHKDALNSPVAKQAQKIFQNERIQIVTEKPLKDSEGALSAEEFARSKRRLYLAPFQGVFFKRCPGARPGLSCCNYFVLNLGSQCTMNCSYCYLQNLINSPLTTVYTNIEQALGELKEIAQTSSQTFRVGTGEITDSLVLDELTNFSIDLVEFFRQLPQWQLEFKTKSSRIENLLKIPASSNVIVSWSINPQSVIEHEEYLTADLYKRLESARKCRDHGYRVAFHIDPMIWHPKWQKNYDAMISLIQEQFSPQDVQWITVGALRFQPEQRWIMKERFGMNSYVTQAELTQSSDGKLRYPAFLREEMFKHVRTRFASHSPLWRLSLCMEVKESWVATMSTTPRQIPEIKDLFEPRRHRSKTLSPAANQP